MIRWGIIRGIWEDQAATVPVAQLISRVVKHIPVNTLGALTLGATLIVPAAQMGFTEPNDGPLDYSSLTTLPVIEPPSQRTPSGDANGRSSHAHHPEFELQLSSLERLATMHQPRPDGGTPNLRGFAIAATLDDIQGAPVVKPLANGETIALRALVPMPTVKVPLLSETLWQIVDDRGIPVPGYFEGVGDWETGGTRDAQAEFVLKGLTNGAYTIRLTHRLPQWLDVNVTAEIPFTVYQAVDIDQIWVTDTEDDVVDRKGVLAGQTAHLYVSYHTEPGVPDVLINLIAHNQDGAVLGTWEKHVGRDVNPFQRVGMVIDRKHLNIGDTIVFDATITGPDDKPQIAAKTFPVRGHPVAITAPPSLESGQTGEYSIFVPPYFVPPLRVDLRAPGLGVDRSSSQPLSGTLSGRAQQSSEVRRLWVQVTDREHRVGIAEALVIVTPPWKTAGPANRSTRSVLPAREPAPNVAVAQSDPSVEQAPSNLPASDFAEPIDSAVLKDSRATGIAAPKEAAFPEVDFSALATDIPADLGGKNERDSAGVKSEPGRAEYKPEKCRKSFDQFRTAVFTRNNARTSMTIYHETFIANVRSRAQHAKNPDQYSNFETLWSSLSTEKDCSVFTFSVKDHPVSRSMGYDASQVLKECRLHENAAAAVLSARFSLQDHNCLAPNGLLRPGILNRGKPAAPQQKSATLNTGR